MKLTPYCVACILTRRSLEIEELEKNSTKGGSKGNPHAPFLRSMALLKEMLNTLELYAGPDMEVADLVSASFRHLTKLTDGEIIKVYDKILSEYIEMAKHRADEIVETFKKDSENLDKVEALKKALYASALSTGFSVFDDTLRLLKEPPTFNEIITYASSRKGRDDFDKFLDILVGEETGDTIYFLFGRVTEIPYDKILIEQIKSVQDIKIVGLVRRNRIEDYATYDDLHKFTVVDLLDNIITIDNIVSNIEKNNRFGIEHVRLIVVKGPLQTLYMYNNPLSKPVLALFTSTCRVSSKVLGVKENSINIYIIPPRKQIYQKG